MGKVKKIKYRIGWSGVFFFWYDCGRSRGGRGVGAVMQGCGKMGTWVVLQHGSGSERPIFGLSVRDFWSDFWSDASVRGRFFRASDALISMFSLTL